VVAERQLPHPTERQAALLKAISDQIQHGDERFAEHRVTAGDLLLIVPHEYSIEIGSVRLPFKELASCITKLHRAIDMIRAAPSK
jgi:hypothetical protein